MLSYLLSDIICQTFEKEIGRGQNRRPVAEQKAMLVGFRIPINYDKEDGYRQFDLLVYGPMNYVGVYIRERSHVAPLDKDGEVSEEYVKTVGEWKCVGYHDSCWRDSIKQEIHRRGNDLQTFDGVIGRWYDSVSVPEEILNDPELGRRNR